MKAMEARKAGGSQVSHESRRQPGKPRKPEEARKAGDSQESQES